MNRARLALAGLCLTYAAAAVSTASAGDGGLAARVETPSDAAFRNDARTVYRILQPVCPQTAKPDLLTLYAPYRDRLSRIEADAAGTRHAAILEGEREANLALAAVVDCARPDWPGVTRESLSEQLKPAGPALDRLHHTLSTLPPRRR